MSGPRRSERPEDWYTNYFNLTQREKLEVVLRHFEQLERHQRELRVLADECKAGASWVV
jgi:hypothetical protein